MKKLMLFVCAAMLAATPVMAGEKIQTTKKTSSYGWGASPGVGVPKIKEKKPKSSRSKLSKRSSMFGGLPFGGGTSSRCKTGKCSN